MERTQLNALLQFIKNIGCDNREIAATVFKLAADSIALDTLKSLYSQEYILAEAEKVNYDL